MAEERLRNSKISKPIRRSVLISYGIFFLSLALILAVLSVFLGSTSIYEHNKEKLRTIINHVEHHIDADDLAQCIRSGQKSEKYEELQKLLNNVVDDLELEYFYIVIPSEKGMINVISGTSKAERDAGEADVALLELSDAYSDEELARYESYWNADEIGYFEESSDWGRFYTGVKPLRDSKGNTVALICGDVSLDAINSYITRYSLSSSVFIAVICIGFAIVMYWWVRLNISDPIMALERSSREFAQKTREAEDLNSLNYEAPDIQTGNEVEYLSNTIEEMIRDMQKYSRDLLEAQKQVEVAESEAKAAQKIAELQQSVSSLLENMPAMTFSKDANTGVYLACNQSFADYAGKASPEEVVGLTDADMFETEVSRHYVEADRFAMTRSEPYVYYEDVKDAYGNSRQLQTTKQRFIDATGRLCVLGMSVDVTELVNIRRENQQTRQAYQQALDESLTYNHIVHALAADYSYLYYVDLNNDEFVEYRASQDYDELIVERRGRDFFEQSRKDAGEILYPEDVEMFREAFTKEKIVSALNEHDNFTLTYRMKNGDEPVYMNMKATRMSKEDSHIIIGINNVDAQMKQKEADERIAQERITYNRINALTGDYISIYTIDPKTDHYLQYSGNEEYDTLRTKKEGVNFFRDSLARASTAIYPEDLERFTALFNKEHILSEIEKNGIFTMRYRLVLNDQPRSVNLKAALVEEKDGPQLIVGINDIDVHVKQEEEYAYNLSQARALADVDALTGVKNKHAYVDFEEKLNERLENEKDVKFALVLFDVNNLKDINDTYGHQVGDRYIRDTSRIICNIFKHSPVFRFGGDEFVVIAEGSDYDQVDELLRQLDENNDKKDGIVIAYGMSRNEGDRNVAAVFARADALMYENKRMLKARDNIS